MRKIIYWLLIIFVSTSLFLIEKKIFDYYNEAIEINLKNSEAKFQIASLQREKENKTEKIIDSLIGKYGGSCKQFVDKYADILKLEIRKQQFVAKINHYYFVVQETDKEMEILDSNWRWDGIIHLHWVRKK